MAELSNSVTLLYLQVNIVPFGSIQIIDSHYNECQTAADNEEEIAYEFPTGSVISGSIIYDQLTIYPKSP